MVLWKVSPTNSEGVEVRLEPSLSSKLAFHLPPGAVIEEVPCKLPQGEGQTSAWIKIQAISGRTGGVDEGWVRKCAPAPWSGMRVGGEGPRPSLRKILPGDSVRLWEAGALLHDPEAAPPGPAARRAAAGRGSHVCLCSFGEMGHVIPTLRLAAVFAGLKRVGTVTVVTNTRRVKDVMQCVETELGQWSSLRPADRQKVRWIACEDGCTEDRLEEARGEEHDDWRWQNFQDKLQKYYKPLLHVLARDVDLFVVDSLSWGMDSALRSSVGRSALWSFPQPITALASQFHPNERVLYHCPQVSPGRSLRLWPAWISAGLLPVGCCPLPKNVREFLDGSEKRVVLVSMGSQAPSVGERTYMTALRDSARVLIQHHHCRVIWSVSGAQRRHLGEGFFRPLEGPLAAAGAEGDLLQDCWLPQASLLKEAKVKAFISHCGWNSCVEAVSAGKPMVCCPLQGDQPFNADYMVSLQMATKVQTWPRSCRHFRFSDVVQLTLDALEEPRLLAAAQEQRRRCEEERPLAAGRLEAQLPPPKSRL